MSGINGFNWSDKGAVERMNAVLKHRGPDGEGIYLDDYVSLGHCRLAVVDLSEKGRQPMGNEDESIWLVCDGGVYNFKELRKELEQRGHRFKSSTGAEVIIHAYEEWQVECLDRFNGMFAFAVYDSNCKKLFLARDRYGIKSLYYYADNGRFIFSSEIKGILSHPVERKPNDRVIFEYLRSTLVQHRSETFFERIWKLPPGSYLVYDLTDHSLSIRGWYELQLSSLESVSMNKRERAERVREVLTDSTRLRLVADVPVGSLLSGGLDSTSIVCLRRQLMPEGEIKTFSSLFVGTGLDESGYISEVVNFAGLESYTTVPTEENLLDDLSDLVLTQEEPCLQSVYGQYAVVKLAHEQGVKVLLGGQGGDELFGGYIPYFGFYFYELFRRLRWYRLLREMFFYLRSYQGLLPFQVLGLSLLPEEIRDRVRNARTKWISRELYDRFDGGGSAGDRPCWVGSLNKRLLVSLLYSSIPRLVLWGDKNSMRWGVEARLPFLDHRLVELAASLPPEDKLRDGITKYILREAVREFLPGKIVGRKRKTPFDVPGDRWLRHPKVVRFTKDLIESAAFKGRPYWEFHKVQKRFEAYTEKRRVSDKDTNDCWKWINLELWLRQFIDKGSGQS